MTKVENVYLNSYLNSFEFEWRKAEEDWALVEGCWDVFPTKSSHVDLWGMAINSDPKWFTPWAIQHHCNKWVCRATGLYPWPHNVFHSYQGLEIYEKATRASFYAGDKHFMRFWLDRMIENTGDSIWNHIYNAESEINKGHRKCATIADKAANEFHKEFETFFK